MSSPSSGRVARSGGVLTRLTIRKLLLIFLRHRVYQRGVTSRHRVPDRPDIVAATRGGDDSLGMEGEADLATASLEQALFWRNIYTEILTMEEAVLGRIHQLMDAQSPQVRREVELTNVPVVVAQAERFRSRLGYWTAACRRIEGTEAVAESVTP